VYSYGSVVCLLCCPLRYTTCVVYSDEEEEFRQPSSDVYEKIAKSIAPSIFGCEDMKKSIACLLFGGSRKRYVNGR